jgi:uridylate kinase
VAGRTKSKHRFRRIVLKISGEALLDKKSSLTIDPRAAASVAASIQDALRMKVQTAVVVGGGNIIRGGLQKSGRIGRLAGDAMGMLATVINALAIKNALDNIGVKSIVQSAVGMDRFVEPVSIERAVSELERGHVVFFAGGTGNPYFTTDTAAALRTLEIGADALLKATKVDGVYSSDPVKNPKAKRFRRISYSEAIARRLGVMDATAFSLCMDGSIPIVVFDFFRKGNMKRVLEGRSIGTVVS